jgi:3-deoxy-manno-octulosonate cytidylyltransferase (CMP-KDO synthetase)
MQPRVACVVPARLGSTRFFGKLLTPLFGKPVVVHALERAAGAGCFDAVVCLTDSPEIGSVVAEHGFEWVLSGEASNGTERIGKSLAALDALGVDADLFVNLQGDEPAFPEDGLRALCAALRAEPGSVHLLVHEDAPTAEEIANPNRVKAAMDDEGLVAGFFRTAAANRGLAGDMAYRLQLGAYGYGRAYLAAYAALPPSAEEIALSHEILRAPGLAPLRAHPARPGASVDVPEDLAAAERALTTATFTERQVRLQGAPA